RGIPAGPGCRIIVVGRGKHLRDQGHTAKPFQQLEIAQGPQKMHLRRHRRDRRTITQRIELPDIGEEYIGLLNGAVQRRPEIDRRTIVQRERAALVIRRSLPLYILVLVAPVEITIELVRLRTPGKTAVLERQYRLGIDLVDKYLHQCRTAPYRG